MKIRKSIKFTCILIIVALFLSVGMGAIAKISIDKENQTFFDATKKLKEDKTLVAIVNGEKIYQYQIDIQNAAQELSKKNIVAAGGDEKLAIIKTEDEIIENLIRQTVVFQEAKNQKLTAKYSEAKKYQEEQISMIMSANDEQSRFLEQYLQEMSWSEKEFIEHAATQWQREMTKSNLKNKFFEKNSSATEQDYEEYVDRLVEAAEIEYK